MFIAGWGSNQLGLSEWLPRRLTGLYPHEGMLILFAQSLMSCGEVPKTSD